MEFITENYIQLGSAQNSNLYDAINNAVDQLIETSLSNNKSVTIIFSNLDDGGSSITSLQLIQKLDALSWHRYCIERIVNEFVNYE